ncbi:endonuclease/exonuclease/phosphatase family protein [Aliidiomarina quisquiliarum]|uniref:endonuclease/exonuclease/phosphatase family protein n=1 Tax=Aliidiomarina quisquiliarum TaxID=2938947 RepID=UPI00208EEAD2|nr:endonuclease/exonuclease/phosphatase family protein [Aliidiomarina quisquiliarum]MCO4321408.1 endonuclease/exonuclease/phosphatase family protein [Aliidiomarina quisquiliarum]
MLKPNIIAPQRFIHQQPIVRGEEFGVLCWNTQKLTETVAFQVELARVLSQFPSLFLLFQEAKLALQTDVHFPKWSYAVAPNMQTNKAFYGVLTASQFAFTDAQARLTLKREGIFATFKSYMLSYHPLSNGQTLLVVNVHAINFVSANYFLMEIELLKAELLDHNGPLIVAGDFNVWSRQRRLYLRQFCRSVGLRQAYMQDAQHIKAYRQHPLDFIFYRDLWLKEATAIDTTTVSDHNPIYARFAV